MSEPSAWAPVPEPPGGGDSAPASLGETLRRLEARVLALEAWAAAQPAIAARSAAPGAAAAVPAAAADGDRLAAPAAGPSMAAGAFNLTGRALLILAGAYLLRLLAESGLAPAAAGASLGLAYALILIWLGHRAAGRGQDPEASVYALTGAIVGYPLLWETTARQGAFSPGTGAIALAALTAAGLGSAWQRRLRLGAWTFTVAPVAAAMGLGFVTTAPLAYAAVLTALGVATCWLAYTRGWHLQRWLAAAAADLVVLRLAVMAADSQVAARRLIPVTAVQVLAVALAASYLGTFAYRALAMGRGVRVFDLCQSALAVAVGFFGAERIALAWGRGAGALGWTALAAGAAAYAAAFTVVRRRHGRGRGFFYFAWLGLTFLFLSSRLLAPGAALGWCWILLGGAAAVLGARFDRMTLRAHAVVCLLLAAIRTGLAAAVLDAFLAPADSGWAPWRAPAGACLGALAASYLVLILQRGARSQPLARQSPRMLAAVLVLLGCGGLGVTLLGRAFEVAGPAGGAAALAVVRTGVLAAAAVGLALAARRGGPRETGWLVHPVLAAGCLKLLAEDLRHGTPLSLALSFGLFGAALVAAPRLLRGGRRAEVVRP